MEKKQQQEQQENVVVVEMSSVSASDYTDGGSDAPRIPPPALIDHSDSNSDSDSDTNDNKKKKKKNKDNKPALPTLLQEWRIPKAYKQSMARKSSPSSSASFENDEEFDDGAVPAVAPPPNSSLSSVNPTATQTTSAASVGRPSERQRPMHPAAPDKSRNRNRSRSDHGNGDSRSKADGFRQINPPVSPSRPSMPGQPWSSDIFGCMEDPDNCLLTFTCPCVTFGQIAEVLDEGNTSCTDAAMNYLKVVIPCLYSFTYRTKLRAKYGLQELPYSDFLTHFLCPCCALSQEYRELHYRGFNPQIGWQGDSRSSNPAGQVGAGPSQGRPRPRLRPGPGPGLGLGPGQLRPERAERPAGPQEARPRPHPGPRPRPTTDNAQHRRHRHGDMDMEGDFHHPLADPGIPSMSR